MKKDDYIFYLNKALKGELPPEKVKYYTDYYKQYIDEEVRNGRKQQDVIDELGHPNMIAKSVIEAERMSGGETRYYTDVEEDINGEDNSSFRNFKIKGIIGVVLFIIALILILSLAMGLFLILLRVFFPIIVIVGIIYLVKKLM